MVDPLSYATYSFVMSITPGPNNVMLTAAGATFGFRRTVPHMVGIATGVAVQTLAVCAGLGALFAQWPEIQTILRWAGALYLIYLGWRMMGVRIPRGGLRGGAPRADSGSRDAAETHARDASATAHGACAQHDDTGAAHGAGAQHDHRQAAQETGVAHPRTAGGSARPVTLIEAAIFQFLNPKAWIMTLTAASLFLPKHLSLLTAGAYMVAVMVVINLPCIAVWALFGSSLRTLLARPASRVAFNAAMALALVATGVIMVM